MSSQLLTTSATHPNSLVSLADTFSSYVWELFVHTSWSPAVGLAERAVVALLEKITIGQLRIVTSTRQYVFGDKKPSPTDPTCEIEVLNDAFWLRLAAMSDLGFSEAYMYGEIRVSSLLSAFKLFLLNRESLSSLSTTATYLVTVPQTWLISSRFVNSIANSRSNISAHYDISNAMFAAFLSQDMTYSSAIFEDLDGDLPEIETVSEKRNGHANGHADGHTSDNGDANGNGHAHPESDTPFTTSNRAKTLSLLSSPLNDPLYDAQIRKLKHIIRKADIKPGHRVLEIGSGWGSLSILAVRMTGCTVDTLTLSSQQQSLAQARIKAAGLSSSINVHLMDYRNVPEEWNGTFDRFVSIEMMEAVGRVFLEEYWRVVDRCLKKKGAAGVVQVITIPEARLERYTQEIDFIRKWVLFPGGFLPSLTLLISSMEKATKGSLVVDSVSNIGPHYARTLREWRRRFEARFESDIVPALRAEYPDVMGEQAPRGREEIDVFKRKWIYYYCYCEIGFTERVLGDHIMTFTREGDAEYGCQVYE